MGCGCGKTTKTLYTVTYSDGSTYSTTSRPDALAKAKINGGTISSKIVPK